MPWILAVAFVQIQSLQYSNVVARALTYKTPLVSYNSMEHKNTSQTKSQNIICKSNISNIILYHLSTFFCAN